MGFSNFNSFSELSGHLNGYAEYFRSKTSTIDPSIIVTAIIGFWMLLGLVTFKTMHTEAILPGVPELKGWPVLGAMPTYLKFGMPQLLGKLIAIGDDGVSFTNVSLIWLRHK